MKNNFFLYVLTLGLLMSCSKINSEGINDKRIIHLSIKEAATDIQKKYGFDFSGIYEECDKENNNKYKVIGLTFSTYSYKSKAEARKIIMDATNIFLEKLNTEKNRPFLTVFPFTEKNIRLSFIVKIPDKDLDYTQATFFGNSRGKIYYWYDIPNEKYKTREEQETYSEALKILGQQ